MNSKKNNKKDVINVNVNKSIKEEAMKIFKNNEITMTDAIEMFLNKIVEYNGIPFELIRKKKH